MTGEMQYYVILAGQDSQGASGLARRTFADSGPVDQVLRGDLTWAPDSAIVEWEYGDLSAELIKISSQEAESLIEAFRARWPQTS